MKSKLFCFVVKNIFWKEIMQMDAIYVSLIIYDPNFTFSEVPDVCKENVKRMLTNLGYGHLAK